MRVIIRFLSVLILLGVMFRVDVALGQGGATGAISERWKIQVERRSPTPTYRFSIPQRIS